MRSRLIERGAELFASEATGCSSCHFNDGSTTDGILHDVGSMVKRDEAADFDTPSLRHIAGTAPYFHDGRYPTLLAMLRDPKSQMGDTSQLSNDDILALETYLRSL
ncbi:c-type cytochrome [Endomicrobium sp. AH-315-J14]|nr:c-type cytochrome [Endomicrobium sp. AH-315-J14]